jgi:hypothetical protein
MANDDSFTEDEGADDEMPWESAARGRVEWVLEDIRFDEVRGVVYVMSGEDHRMNTVEEEFDNYEDMLRRLSEIYDEEWYGNVPFDGGEAVFRSDSYGEVGDLLADKKVEDFFERMRTPEEGEELANAKKLIIPAGGLIVEGDLAEINDELVNYLAKHPELMHKMDPHKFEELVATLLKAKGYDVEVTKRTRDGGLDIRACKKSDVGTLLTMTQCKRYAPHRKVTVEAVRQLYGVVESDKATNGLIITTSTFTSPAKVFQEQNKYRMSLADMEDLKNWLRDLRIGRSS